MHYIIKLYVIACITVQVAIYNIYYIYYIYIIIEREREQYSIYM